MSETTDRALVADIERLLRKPVYFRDVLAAVGSHPYRAILRAWSDIRTRHSLSRDEFGRYWLEKQ